MGSPPQHNKQTKLQRAVQLLDSWKQLWKNIFLLVHLQTEVDGLCSGARKGQIWWSASRRLDPCRQRALPEHPLSLPAGGQEGCS